MKTVISTMHSQLFHFIYKTTTFWIQFETIRIKEEKKNCVQNISHISK